MFFNSLVVVAAIVGSGLAQRPSSTSICDYYTTALLKDNNATNQYTLLTLLVNTAVIGNYTQPNHNAVPGILNPNATFNGTAVNLAKYFDGALKSTNENGQGSAVNFLDGGGAAPLMMNKPANDTTSMQYGLLTHLYSYFGAALNCSTYGKSGFPAYTGAPSMYTVHKFMDLDANEVGYFIQQVGLSATSFGVTTDDATAVGQLLTTTFDGKCSAAATVIPSQGPQLQAICTADGCPMAANANCSAYDANPGEPANATAASGSPSSSSKGGAISNGSVSVALLAAVSAVVLFALAM